MSEKGDDYELCMRAENVNLPKQGYFGVTAATGGLAGIPTSRSLLKPFSINFRLIERGPEAKVTTFA